MESQPTAPIILDPTGADPNGEHERLRSQGAAVLVDVLGVQAWSINDPALLKSLLKNNSVSKDARAHWPDFNEAIQTWPLALWVAVNNMFTAYSGDHRRLRRIIAPALSPRRMDDLAAVVEGIVKAILDELDTQPAGEVIDLRERVAYPLPIAVIGHLMGLPADQRTGFRAVVDGVFDTTLSAEAQEANTARLYAALDELINSKRANPGDDMTSVLIASRDDDGDGRGLSDAELRDTLLLMISAGYETTVNLIDQAISLLLTHPEQLDHLRSGRANWSDVVEETLRLEPPVKHIPMRFAIDDISLPDGQVIAKGDGILASYAAANRHPDWHENPHVFDTTRTSQGHLAFGYGVHFCLGAPLARLEVSTVLQRFFDRFPDAQLAVAVDEMPRLQSLISNGHTSVPVRLQPAPAPRQDITSAQHDA
ncbi:cytochrome P450 (plasmid) [Streptomyces sp. NBC_01281]|uniref:cytochrome P450 family protein n=1 Tax=Streptomyces sp. NBC_01281 TaxID=2903811 RepID=UPI002E0F0E97|nr:cytochrome P450 [Streptomyces sp. NBC_01281]